ncbi:hypothetical protein GH714_010197 [Hevea brasiliensis]|uniref:Protein kinase domain-containing protein n=1 Tax=Hevea brasiliensis TaxID=3981 RepID=A0A6A6M9R3_HEVBR|nr:hypothetical protein GH714_010197 [Hevea brasiliensis]
MGKLERVYLSNNSFYGEIPAALGGIPHLGLLDLSKNKLSGTIPPSLGKCINLEILDLSHNEISGTIPSAVAALRSLKLYLNLSSNHLQGPLPLELSKMDMVLAIDLSSNNLSGSIPTQLGSCIALEHLNLSGNMLEGPLPASIGQLPYLKQLDVSSNQLSGEIPQSLEESPTQATQLLFQQFLWNVSDKGAFLSLTIDSFLGNKGLCGTIKGMPKCRIKHAYHSLILPILLSLFATPFLCVFLLVSICSDVAEAVAYLHHYSPVRVVHCDLKPCNILLDDDMTALVTDFGIARLVKGVDESSTSKNDSVSFSSADGCLCGSVGYIAPEAMLRIAPSAMPAYCNKIWSVVIVELIELGLMCTQYNPSTRPIMLDVAHEMARLKQFLSNPPSLLIEEEEASSKVGAS